MDWSIVESELASKSGRGGGEPLSARPRTASPTLPSTSSGRLNTYRRGIEEEGTESGRTVQQQYRQELIQMNRGLVEERGQDQAEEPPSAAETWLERLGEHLGDFLAEPSASQIIAALVIVTLIVAIALGCFTQLSARHAPPARPDGQRILTGSILGQTLVRFSQGLGLILVADKVHSSLGSLQGMQCRSRLDELRPRLHE